MPDSPRAAAKRKPQVIIGPDGVAVFHASPADLVGGTPEEMEARRARGFDRMQRAEFDALPVGQNPPPAQTSNVSIGQVDMTPRLPSQEEVDAAVAADPSIMDPTLPTAADMAQVDAVSGVVDDPNGPPSPEQVANRALWAQREADKKRMRRERSTGPTPGTPDVAQAAGAPVVRTSASGAPVVGAPAEDAVPPAPETTEELQARLAAEELANVDNPALLPEVAQARIKNLQEQGMSEAEAMKGVAELRAQHADQMEANAQRINAAMDEAIERHRVAQEDMRARADALYATRFEPRRIFSSPDAAANVGVHLGVAVGAMLQSFQNVHFPGSNAANTALSIVDRAIEADIAQQREAFSRGEGQLRQDSAAMEAMNRLGVQEVDALMFTRMAATEQVAEQLSSLAAAHAGTAAGQRFEQAALAMRERYMMLRGQLDVQAMQLAAQNARRAGGGAAPDEGDPFALNRFRFTLEEESDDPRVRAGAASYRSLKINEQNKINTQLLAHEAMVDNLNALNNLFVEGSNGMVTLSPSARQVAATLSGNNIVTFADANNLGALDTGLMDLMNRIQGEPDAIFTIPSRQLAAIRTQIGVERNRQEMIRQTWGISLVPRSRDTPTPNEIVNNSVSVHDDDPETNHVSNMRSEAFAATQAENRAANQERMRVTGMGRGGNIL